MAGYVAKPAEPGRTLPCTDSLSVPCAHALVRERERETSIQGLSASWPWLSVLSGSGVRQHQSHLSFPHESPGASVSYDL